MARATQLERLQQLAEAATTTFGRLGYRRTHMADVTTAVGMSAGAVYTYVGSKEALFHLVFTSAFGPGLDRLPPLPLATPAPEETIRVISEGLRKRAGTPLLRAALHDDAPTDVRAELTAIIDERYSMIEGLWPVLAVIEASASDLPALEELYFQGGRRGHIGQLARYLDQRAAGGFLRAMPDAAVAARIVTEAITWFAWHRRNDRDAALYDDGVARRTVIAFVCSALIEPGR